MQRSIFLEDYKTYTITAALPYANGPLHIGHIAGSYLPADIYVRYLRLEKKEVVFICGSDEHGAAITIKALKENTSPQKIVDQFHAINKESFEKFGISFDVYHRTSSDLHHKTAQAFFKDLHSTGKFTKKTSKQYFDPKHQQFLADRYIQGECPKCENPNAYGDQCEKCGSALSPLELKHPRSTLSDQKPELKETSHYYFPLNQYEAFLKEWVLNQNKDWKPNVYGQCKSWIDAGLKERAMTRDLSWGVKLPLENTEGKVMYVWLDAPIGYISATKHWANQHNKNWRDYWQNPKSKLVHFLGKDNIVFHCIIFPSLLKAHSENYNLPKAVPANEFLNLEGDKISTSRNHAVWLNEYLSDFKDKQDELRYVLCSIAPQSKDSEFTWLDFQARVNNELVSIFGNFVNRTVVLTHKYYKGNIPNTSWGKDEQSAYEQLLECAQEIKHYIEHYKFREAQAACMRVARLGNKYLADLEPWKLQKIDPERVKQIMGFANYLTLSLGILSEPFLPFTAKKIKDAYGYNTQDYSIQKENVTPFLTTLKKLDLLFEKITDEQVETQKAKLIPPKKTTNMPDQKEEITFDDFLKIDVRVGKILTAEKVEKADKLLKLSVDVGLDTRTIVSGIAEYFSPEDIIGKLVCVVLNLAPRKIRGVESKGMILMAESENSLTFVSPRADALPGAEVR